MDNSPPHAWLFATSKTCDGVRCLVSDIVILNVSKTDSCAKIPHRFLVLLSYLLATKLVFQARDFIIDEYTKNVNPCRARQTSLKPHPNFIITNKIVKTIFFEKK